MVPIRILQVVTIMNRGGLETMLMNYYRKMDRSKIQFDFMVHRGEEGHYDQEILEMGGRIYKMPRIKPGNYRRYFKSLNEFFKKHTEYSVVHSHVNENSSFVLRAAKRAGIEARIAHSHLSDLKIDLKIPFRLYARYCMKGNPNYYFACSEKAGKWLFNKKPSSARVKVLTNAVDVEKFKLNKKVRDKVRNELGITNELLVGHIGRFNKQKNHMFLIDIFKVLIEINPSTKLVLIGEGHLRSEIQNKIEVMGLSQKVELLGTRSDISDLMQAMDIFVFPSLFEGLPVVLIEAQAAGLNCIVSDSVTNESDITGRIKFLSLDEPTEKWAKTILTTNAQREDTSDLIKKQGYDSTFMARWLYNFYSSFYSKYDQQLIKGG